MSTITVRPHCGATGSSRGMEVTLGKNTRITANAKAATRVVVATVKALFVAGHKSADVKQYNATGKCLEHKRFFAVGGSKVISEAKPEAKAAPAKPKAGKPAATGNTRVNTLVASGYDLATARKLAAAEQGKPAPAAKPRKPKARKPKAAAESKPAAKPKARKPKATAAAPAKKAAAKKTADGTTKRKPSAYNKFVKAYFKANANATMKSAAAAWQKSQGGAAAKPAKAKGAKATSAKAAPKSRVAKTRTSAKSTSASAAKGAAAKPKAVKGKRSGGKSKNPWIATVKRHWPGYKAQGWAYKDFLSDLGTRKAAGESL